MTQNLIKEQIVTIQKATENASKSKETALKFLKDAGIISNGQDTTAGSNAQSKKKK